ncbi:MAG: hypothetical protein RLY93_18200 [Sumerlaeia bacterium]
MRSPLLPLITAVLALGWQTTRAESPLRPAFHRGVCLEGGLPLEPCHIEELTATGVTHVSLNPFGWMESASSTEVHMRTESGGGGGGRWFGERDDGLRQYASLAREAGMTVMLRPHIWLRRGGKDAQGNDLWLDDIGFETEAQWQAFFASYTRFAVHYAALAEDAGMAWYSVGAEMTRATRERPEDWRRVIAACREVYRGKLIYSANWYEEAEALAFGDALDAIGVQAYFPLAEAPGDRAEDLAARFEGWLDRMEAVSRRAGRPVIFTEIGYKATPNALVEPWVWREDGGPSPATQALGYRVALAAMADEEWLAGAYWWKYHADPCATAQPRRPGDFTWQGQPAAEILARAYRGLDMETPGSSGEEPGAEALGNGGGR